MTWLESWMVWPHTLLHLTCTMAYMEIYTLSFHHTHFRLRLYKPRAYLSDAFVYLLEIKESSAPKLTELYSSVKPLFRVIDNSLNRSYW